MEMSWMLCILFTVTCFKVASAESCFNSYYDEYYQCDYGCCGDGYDTGCCTVTGLAVGAAISAILFTAFIICVCFLCYNLKYKQGSMVTPFNQQTPGITVIQHLQSKGPTSHAVQFQPGYQPPPGYHPHSEYPTQHPHYNPQQYAPPPYPLTPGGQASCSNRSYASAPTTSQARHSDHPVYKW